tara:strand:- start:397 stop:963 length:567 start_codon:yes stop_codon:yes gene_type:complete
MILKYAYWYFPKAIPKSLCQLIINEGLNSPGKKGLVGGTKGIEFKKKMNLRDSDVVFMNQPWIKHIVTPYINQANIAAGWNFQLDGPETPQFTIYNKNQFYDWHSDSFEEPENGFIRKLSMSLILSDKKDYSGGQFMFNIQHKPVECKEVREQGSIVVFPSHQEHMVKPVTKGTRYSLVVWQQGRPFR